MKIFIIRPPFNFLGGISYHYRGLAPFWKEDVTYLPCGRRNKVPALLTLIPDWFRLFFRLIIKKPDVILVNTSLLWPPLFRDAIFILIASLFRVKVATFIHGWNDNVYNKLSAHPSLFTKIYNKSIFLYVLCSDFRDSLVKIGITKPILLNSTKVDNHLLDNYYREYKEVKPVRILFLARADYDKGLDVAIETVKILQDRKVDVKFTVCGVGPFLEDAKQQVKEYHIDHIVDFKGYVYAEKKRDNLINNDIYLFPTKHGEGMPASVLEAMAMGLAVVTRPVGGIKDFFEHGKMGFLTESVDPSVFADLIENLCSDYELVKTMSHYNHEFASQHFLASIVVDKMENDFRGYI